MAVHPNLGPVDIDDGIIFCYKALDNVSDHTWSLPAQNQL